MRSERQTLTVTADLDSLEPVRGFVHEVGIGAGLSEDQAGNLLLAVDEAVTNIITHGYESSTGDIEIDCLRENGHLMIALRDHAPVYNPLLVEAPDLTQSPMDREAPGGFGMVLIKSMVDEVHYRTLPDGRNELTLISSIG